MSNSNTPRSIHELLELVLHYLEIVYFTTGLCLLIEILKNHKIITHDEYCILMLYLINNSPNNKDIDEYYWPPYMIRPRREWLIKHIKLNKET